MIRFIWQDQYIFNTNRFFDSWLLSGDDVLGFKRRIRTKQQVLVISSESKQKSRVFWIWNPRIHYNKLNDNLQNTDKEYLFFLNIYREMSRFFYQTFWKPLGTISQLPSFATKFVKHLTAKEKLWHASQNGCMVYRSHRLTNGR